jgi:hypothetical protein
LLPYYNILNLWLTGFRSAITQNSSKEPRPHLPLHLLKTSQLSFMLVKALSLSYLTMLAILFLFVFQNFCTETVSWENMFPSLIGFFLGLLQSSICLENDWTFRSRALYKLSNIFSAHYIHTNLYAERSEGHCSDMNYKSMNLPLFIDKTFSFVKFSNTSVAEASRQLIGDWKTKIFLLLSDNQMHTRNQYLQETPNNFSFSSSLFLISPKYQTRTLQEGDNFIIVNDRSMYSTFNEVKQLFMMPVSPCSNV